ncbi:hypothetical protein ACFWIO_08620 [Streptomyces diastatochromogenes]
MSRGVLSEELAADGRLAHAANMTSAASYAVLRGGRTGRGRS